MADNADDKKSSIASEAIDFIEYFDTWKKLAIAIVTVIFCLIFYFAWESRVQISRYLMLEFGMPAINESVIDREVTELMRDINAKSVAVWELDLQSNKRTALYVRVSEKRYDQLEGTTDLAMRPYSEYTANLIKAITYKTYCSKLVSNSSISDEMRKSGVTYVCYAAIPPAHGIVIGLLVAGFSAEPVAEDFVKIRMLDAAQDIIR
jgi:hypothetical protein